MGGAHEGHVSVSNYGSGGSASSRPTQASWYSSTATAQSSSYATTTTASRTTAPTSRTVSTRTGSQATTQSSRTRSSATASTTTATATTSSRLTAPSSAASLPPVHKAVVQVHSDFHKQHYALAAQHAEKLRAFQRQRAALASECDQLAASAVRADAGFPATPHTGDRERIAAGFSTALAYDRARLAALKQGSTLLGAKKTARALVGHAPCSPARTREDRPPAPQGLLTRDARASTLARASPVAPPAAGRKSTARARSDEELRRETWRRSWSQTPDDDHSGLPPWRGVSRRGSMQASRRVEAPREAALPRAEKCPDDAWAGASRGMCLGAAGDAGPRLKSRTGRRSGAASEPRRGADDASVTGDDWYEPRLEEPRRDLSRVWRQGSPPRDVPPSARPDDTQLRMLQQEVQRLAAVIDGGHKAAAGPPPASTARALPEAAGQEAFTEDVELRKLRTEIEKQKRATQLATIKAKGEALRLRQDFELQRFRRKYAAPPDVAAGPAAASDGADASQSCSERSLSVDSNDAFDEPLRVVDVQLLRCGPFEAAGVYAVAATLYNSNEPVPDAAGGAVSGMTAWRQHRGGGEVTLRSGAVLAGVHVDACSRVVFEVYQQKSSLLGVAHRAEVVAWAVAPVQEGGEGGARRVRSSPLLALPITLTAPRCFPVADGATIQFQMGTSTCRPGELGRTRERAARGLTIAAPLADAWRPDADVVEGAVLVASGADGAAADAALLDDAQTRAAPPTEGYVDVRNEFTPPAQPFRAGDGLAVAVDAARLLPGNVTISAVAVSYLSADREELHPGSCAVAQPDSDALNPTYQHLDVIGLGAAAFADPTALAVFQVTAIEEQSGELRVVGTAAVALFGASHDGAQPAARAARDYGLNRGGFQLPLAPAALPEGPLRAAALQAAPRLPCASLLVRVLSVSEAKVGRRARLPAYAAGVYDSRLLEPSGVEALLYRHYLSRTPRPVRAAARGLADHAQKRAPRADGDASDGDGAPHAGAAPAGERELLAWLQACLQPPPQWNAPLLDLTYAHPYLPEAGFLVAVDGASRLGRLLPCCALCSASPPAAFYQDQPVRHDVKASMLYDLAAPLAAPRWLDGPQPLEGYADERGLCVIVDLRYISPSTGASTPAGWAALPVLHAGAYVAAGAYQLPLFRGLPSMGLLTEMQRSNDVEGTLARALQDGRVKYDKDQASVFVRLLDGQRAAQLAAPAHAAPRATLRVPDYAAAAAAAMAKPARSKAYSSAVPKDLSPEAFVAVLNAAAAQLAGLANSGGGVASGYGDGSGAAA